MTQYVAFNKNVEVNGRTITSIIDGMKGFESTAEKFLQQNGLINIHPEKWYPQQAWLTAFRQIAEKIGPKTLTNIGSAIPENAEWPPQVNSIESALQSIDIAYHMNHRLNGIPMYNNTTGLMTEGIGHYHFEKLSETQLKVTCHNPYPCDFDKGLIKAVATKFKPTGINLKFAEHVSSGCRNKDGDKCTYIIEW
jgi:hypothetical protein